MGYIMHDTIIVTAFRKDDALAAFDVASKLNLPVTEIVTSPMNAYFTFIIITDGSKEGWADSDAFNARRAKWFAWAADAHRDGACIAWVHVRYGDNPAYVVAASDDEEDTRRAGNQEGGVA